MTMFVAHLDELPARASSLNVSPATLCTPDLLEALAGGERLAVEITEHAPVEVSRWEVLDEARIVGEQVVDGPHATRSDSHNPLSSVMTPP